MSKHTDRHPLDRRTAERLLDGAPVAGGHPLADLLAAATVPAGGGELAGEDAAVAAFRAARPGPVSHRRPSKLKNLANARIAAVAAAVAVILGGVATAAATGYLPTPLGGHPAVVPAHASAAEPSSTTSSTSHTTKPDNDDHGSPTSGASPSPSLTGLCNAYIAGAGSDHGKALDNPAFGSLIDNAGGRDKVDEYCADLLAGQQGHNGDTNGNGKGHDPKGSPANHPDHTTGPPSTHSNH
ncbi:hypothetical protein [Kutzneria buriramensis]|uniref:Uncharacterized protein n=1 Tax=Kutzneria buriramensis TaxID=1045776 RepID=A0A3E0GVJ4_9PSEU|nr:hypothetical protein [Kutzneria buriramensis]REH27676.1 hypothetical protein BCF44_12964 [Kutzneria buriramensis]